MEVLPKMIENIKFSLIYWISRMILAACSITFSVVVVLVTCSHREKLQTSDYQTPLFNGLIFMILANIIIVADMIQGINLVMYMV